MSEPLLELQNVCKRFGKYSILNNLSLSVGKNEIIGLLGPNGSGKTTTLRIAAGYAWPDAGLVLMSGEKVVPNNPLSRSGIGYLPEKVPLYDPFRVGEHLNFLASVHGLKGQNAVTAVERVVQAFNLSEVRDRVIGHLSKGFRQRIGLAQAMISDPNLILLDEPTNGLDPGQLVEAREMIRHVAKDRAVIFSTHIMQEVTALCTRVVYLLDGSLKSIPLDEGGSYQRKLKARVRCEDIDNLVSQIQLLSSGLHLVQVDHEDKVFDLELACSKDLRSQLSALLVENSELLSFHSESLSIENRVLQLLAKQEIQS